MVLHLTLGFAFPQWDGRPWVGQMEERWQW